MRLAAFLSSLPGKLCLVALCAVGLSLGGCAALTVQDRPPALREGPQRYPETNRFPVAKGDDVVGRLALLRLAKGDTLPDIARHFSLGVSAISAANPGVDVWVPAAGEPVTLPLAFILPDAPRKGIVINLAAMRLFHFKGDGNSLSVTTYPVGIGAEEKPTPTGQMHVKRKAIRPTWHVPASISEAHRKKGDPLPAQVPPGPENPLGECALYLSKSSYLIHGTNKPASVGLNATNGCLRLYPENVTKLYDETPLKTPVLIVNQPYLVGQRNGVMYLEAHTPLENTGAVELEQVFEKLKSLETRSGRRLDWKKIYEVKAEARGIPVCIEVGRGSDAEAAQPVELEHPGYLYGKPEIPELNVNAWYVLVAEVTDEVEAQRMAAIVNHQGPQIPARVLSNSNKTNRHRVIAGPFKDLDAARGAAKRLKIDLEIEGILIEPLQNS